MVTPLRQRDGSTRQCTAKLDRRLEDTDTHAAVHHCPCSDTARIDMGTGSYAMPFHDRNPVNIIVASVTLGAFY